MSEKENSKHTREASNEEDQNAVKQSVIPETHGVTEREKRIHKLEFDALMEQVNLLQIVVNLELQKEEMYFQDEMASRRELLKYESKPWAEQRYDIKRGLENTMALHRSKRVESQKQFDNIRRQLKDIFNKASTHNMVKMDAPKINQVKDTLVIETAHETNVVTPLKRPAKGQDSFEEVDIDGGIPDSVIAELQYEETKTSFKKHKN
jgi:hypothetical protein